MDISKLFVGLAFVILGLSLMNLSIHGNVSYGALILLGPFPVLLASDLGVAVFLTLLASIFLILALMLRL
jgi:uncharacterized membrane protein